MGPKDRIKSGKFFENNELQTDKLKFSNYQECQNSGQTLARWKKLVWVGQRIFVVREAGHPEISHISDFGSVWFKHAQLRM